MRTVRIAFIIVLLLICLTIGLAPIIFLWMPEGDGVYITTTVPMFLVFVSLLIRAVPLLFGVWVYVEMCHYIGICISRR